MITVIFLFPLPLRFAQGLPPQAGAEMWGGQYDFSPFGVGERDLNPTIKQGEKMAQKKS